MPSLFFYLSFLFYSQNYPSLALFKHDFYCPKRSPKPSKAQKGKKKINHIMDTSKSLLFFALLCLSALTALADDQINNEEASSDPGLVMNFYKDTCPQAEDIIKEQVKLLYKRHKNTAFSWLRNIFHDCAVQVYISTYTYIYTESSFLSLSLLFFFFDIGWYILACIYSHVTLLCCWTLRGGFCLRRKWTEALGWGISGTLRLSRKLLRESVLVSFHVLIFLCSPPEKALLR